MDDPSFVIDEASVLPSPVRVKMDDNVTL